MKFPVLSLRYVTSIRISAKVALASAVLLSICAIPVPTEAEVLINDSFETDTAGGDPAGWSLDEAAPSSVNVIDYTGSEGTKSLALFDASMAWRDFATPITSGTVDVTFGVRINSVGFRNSVFTNLKHLNGPHGDAGSAEYSFGIVDFDFVDLIGLSIPEDTGAIAHYDGSSWELLTAGGSPFVFGLDTWHEAALSYNVTTNLISVTFDDTILDQVFPSPTHFGRVNGLLVRSGEGNGGGLIDNIVLSTVAAIPGDYDGSGSVNADDYDLWKSTFGSTVDLRADGNDDDKVDAADYTVWRNNFSAGGSGANFLAVNNSTLGVAVPEPTAISLGGILIGGLLCWRPRR